MASHDQQRRLHPIACLLLISHCSAALAASDDIETVLVTGAYTPQRAITAAATVLDAKEISALNKRSVAGLLKTVPGLLVEEQGGPGGLTAVSIRGGEANFTLVLLDGIPVNDPTNTRGGGFDFGNLSTAQVERIEVVRGAQSAIYGSDAVAGVINIITVRPQSGHAQSLFLEVGEDDYLEAGFSARGKEGDLDYTIEFVSSDEGDAVPGSERDNDSANLRLGWQVSDAHRLSASLRYLDGERTSYPEQSGGPEFAQISDLDQADYEDSILGLRWQARLSENWNSDLHASRFEHEETYTSPGIPPFFEVPPNGSETDYTRDELRWVNSLNLHADYRVDMGADFRAEDGKNIGYVEFFGNRNPTDFELDRDTLGAFAALSAQPATGLLLNASLRYDDPDGFDGETSWSLGARGAAVEGISISANWGESYKLPSFFALGHALVGNPDLQPEKSNSWDIGIELTPADTLSVSATWFYNDFEDLVDFDDETFRNVNRKNVETSGVEVAARIQPTDALSVLLSGTYTDIDVEENTVLTGRPQWQAGLVAQWQLAADWDTTLDYRYTGEQWAASRHTGEEVTQELADYHRVDWVLRWRHVSSWQFALSLDNALDEDYETAVGFAAPGRALRFAAQVDF